MKIYTRISAGTCLNTHGLVDVDAVKRAPNGRYMARIVATSENRPCMWGEGYKTDGLEHWFLFKKSYPLCMCDNARVPSLSPHEVVTV